MSDTDQIPTTNLKHTVSFTRKINHEARGGLKYESSEATFFLQFDTPIGAELSAVVEAATAAYVACKSAVLTQLGIAHDLSEEGVIVEDAAAALALVPGPDAVTQVRAAFGGGEVQHDSASTGATVDLDSMSKWELKSYLEKEFAANPGAFYDNRPKKASGEYKNTSPDVKHKASGKGLWFDKKAA